MPISVAKFCGEGKAMLVAFTDVYDILRRQFGDEDAKRLMDFFQQNLARFATKDDLVQLEQRLMAELAHKVDKEDFTRLWEALERKADKEDVARLEAEINRRALQETVTRIEEELKRKADKEDVAALRAELQRKADKEDVAALRAELQRKADKEDVARLWEALERQADKEDVAQLREMIVRLEWRMNFYFAILLLVILLTNPKVWELLARLLPFMR